MVLKLNSAAWWKRNRSRNLRSRERRNRRNRLQFESLERRDLLAGWTTTGEASVFQDVVRLGQFGAAEDGEQPAAIHGASLEFPPADQYRVGFEYQLASWDSYNNAALGDGNGYWDAFLFSVTSQPYVDLSLIDPVQFPGRGFTWGGTTFGDRQLATAASSIYQTFPGDGTSPHFLNVVLDTTTLPDADEAFPSWGRVVVRANDLEAVELRMETEDRVEFDYRIRGYDVPGTTLEFFWAEGPEPEHILDLTPVGAYSLEPGQRRVPGLHTAQVTLDQLVSPPEGATHLLMVSQEFSNELIVSNNHTALDVFGIDPLHMEVVGGSFSYDDTQQRFAASGTIFIGRSPAAGKDFQPLVQLEGSAWYSRETIQMEGTFFPAIGPLSPLLFEGVVEIKNGSTRSVTLQDANPSDSEFQIGGFVIQFSGIQFHTDGVGLQGNIQLPPALGNVNLSVQGDHWLLFTEQGTEITGGRIEFPDAKFSIQDLLELEATGLAVEYIGGGEAEPNQLKIQGAVSVPAVLGFEADFAGDNYILVSEGEVDLVGELSLQNIVFVPEVWELKEAYVRIDTEESRLAGGGTLRVPMGFDIEAGMEFLEGKLDALMLGLPSLNLAIGTTGAYLQSINGKVENLASDDPLLFSGMVGFTYGPLISVAAPIWLGGPYSGALVRLNVGGGIDRHHLEGTGQVDAISLNPGSGLVTGIAEAQLNWTSNFLSAQANVSMLGGLVTMNATLYGDSGLNVHMAGAAQVRLPDTAFVPFFNGQLVGDGRAHFQYVNDSISTNDYIAAWGAVNLPIYGPRVLGVMVDFTGNWRSIGSFEDVPLADGGDGAEGEGGGLVVEFNLVPGTEELLLHVEWENDQRVAEYRIEAPDGRIWTAGDVAQDDDLAEVPFFESATTRAIVVANPISGMWRVSIADAGELGQIAVDAFRELTNVPPAFNFLGMTPHPERFEFQFQLTDPDSHAIADFYVTTDPEFRGGKKFATREIQQSIVNLHVSDFPAGEYYVYAVASDEVNPPVQVGWEEPLNVGNNAPVIHASWMHQWPRVAWLESGGTLDAVVTATDIDADTLTFTLDASAPVGAKIDSDGRFLYSAPAEQLSRRWYEFMVQVTDDGVSPLSDELLVTLIVSGQKDVTGVLAAGESRYWLRDGLAGQNLVYRPTPGISPLLMLQIFGPQDQLLFEGSAAAVAEVPVELAGKFRFVLTAPSQTGDATYPFHFEVLERVSEDGWMRGAVNPANEPLRFAVDLQAGDDLLLEYFQGAGHHDSVGVIVEGPQGNFFRVERLSAEGDWFPILKVKRTGTYTVYVTPDYDLFEEVDVKLQFRSLVELDPAELGAEATVTIPHGGTIVLPLDLVAGQIVQLDAFDVPDSLEARLYGPDNSPLRDYSETLGESDPQVILQDGRYHWVITSYRQEDLSVTLAVSELIPETRALEYGVRYTAEFPNEPLEFAVVLAAGEMLFVDAFCTDWETSCGPVIFQWSPDPQGLNDRGDYGIVAGESTEYLLIASGWYDFQVDRLGEDERLVPGVPTELWIPAGGESVAFWVDASAGQQLRISAEEQGLDGIRIQYFNAFGLLEGIDRARNVSHDGPVILTMSDMTRIASDDPTELLVTIELLDFEFQTIQFGAVYSGTLTLEESEYFGFFGNAGQKLYFNSLSPDSQADVILTGPGGELFWRSAAEDVGIVELTRDGLYVLGMVSSSADPEYAFKLDDLGAAPLIDYSQILNGNLRLGSETNWYRFEGLEGQGIALTDVSDHWADAELQVFLPSGQFLTTGPLSVGVLALLPESGTYLVAVLGTGQEDLSYSVQWQRIRSNWQNPLQPPLVMDARVGTYRGDPLEIDLSSGAVVMTAELDFESIEIVAVPTNGELVMLGSGRVQYIAAAGSTGEDHFSYRISDVEGRPSELATITILVATSPLQNPLSHGDVNADGQVTPLDALLILNQIARAQREGINGGVPVELLIDQSPRRYYDTDGNGLIVPLDALLVLNQIARDNRLGAGELSADRFMLDPPIAGLPLQSSQDEESMADITDEILPLPDRHTLAAWQFALIDWTLERLAAEADVESSDHDHLAPATGERLDRWLELLALEPRSQN